MISGSFRDSSPFLKFLFVAFTILLGFTFFMVLGMLFAHFIYGAGIKDMNGIEPQNIPALKLLQAFFSLGVFVFPPFLIAVFLNGKIGGYLRINQIPRLHLVLWSILLIFLSLPLINFLVLCNESIILPDSMRSIELILKKMEQDAHKTTESFLAVKSFSGFIANLIVIAILPAIGEELLFRGVIQRILHEWLKNIHFSIFLASFIFSAIHFQFYGFIPRFLLGALFGYLFYWSKNLWIPIIIHFINNSFAVTMYYISGGLAEEAEKVGTGTEMIPSVLFSLISVVILLYLIYNLCKKQTISLEQV